MLLAEVTRSSSGLRDQAMPKLVSKIPGSPTMVADDITGTIAPPRTTNTQSPSNTNLINTTTTNPLPSISNPMTTVTNTSRSLRNNGRRPLRSGDRSCSSSRETSTSARSLHSSGGQSHGRGHSVSLGWDPSHDHGGHSGSRGGTRSDGTLDADGKRLAVHLHVLGDDSSRGRQLRSSTTTTTRLKKKPRIGAAFQAEIPNVLSHHCHDTSVCRWKSRVSPIQVEKYFAKLHKLLPSPVQVSQERALFFLQQCQWDVSAAQKLLAKRDQVPVEAPVEDGSEDNCFVCGDGGEVMVCEKQHCNKVYHLSCLQLSELPSGAWMCPRHSCTECGGVVRDMCSTCPVSYCPRHVPRELQKPELIQQADFKCPGCSSSKGKNKEWQGFIRGLVAILRGDASTSCSLETLHAQVQFEGGIEEVVSERKWQQFRKRVIGPVLDS